MVSNYIVSLVTLFLVTYAAGQNKIFDFDVPIPKAAVPLVPTISDLKTCLDKANGRKFLCLYKLPFNTCRPYCMYENNEIEQYTAEDGQFCCDIGGIGPTGLCKSGDCFFGGVANISTKTGIDAAKKGFDALKNFGKNQ